jgi:23S rRNA pseudouridine1911/1915/1917 synthase
MRVWVVRPGEAGPLSTVLERMNADADALAEGRVFVDRKRVYDARVRVEPGVSVRVSPRTGGQHGDKDARILWKAKGMVAVDKPAGIPTIADHGGDAHALSSVLARTLGLPTSDVHPTSRLDRGVSGVVIFATDAAAREKLRLAREEGRYERRYVALASRTPSPPAGTWDVPIGRAKEPRLRKANGKDAVPSLTRYATVAETDGAAVLALAPVTGRTHQLRVHASHAGAALLGDRDYGRAGNVTLSSGEVARVDRVALHCAFVRLLFGAEEVRVFAEIPAELRELASKLGLEDESWEKAVTCNLSG